MSNVEARPDEVTCGAESDRSAEVGVGVGVEVISPREVPLGGPRAMTVRRTLPSRERSLVGAWCFVDHYGPDPVAGPRGSGGMSVAPHPHTGLQTVSWLFTGEIEHRDSDGHHATVRPGELNLMTAGRGISHSEVSTPETETLHGVQLWVALPDHSRFGEPGFEHYVPETVTVDGVRARVFLGVLLGASSPVATASPLLGAELLLDAGAAIELDVDPGFEHAVLLDTGTVTLEGTPVAAHELGYVAPGGHRIGIEAGDEPVRLVLLGGPPFGEQIVMWWNFVGRTHEEIVEFRERWQAQIEDGTLLDGPYGVPLGDELPPIPAPPLPNARLKHRG